MIRAAMLAAREDGDPEEAPDLRWRRCCIAFKHATQWVPCDTDVELAPAVGRHNIAPPGYGGEGGAGAIVYLCTRSLSDRCEVDGTFLRVILSLAADLLAREIS
jgi:hypothetical protein